MPSPTISLKLRADPSTFSAQFYALGNFADVANLLEIPPQTLGFYLHRPDNYRTFTLKKRSGGHRVIATPTTALKIIQKKLNEVLHAVYRGRSPAHGCIRGKSIITNANRHLTRQLILNLDLKDFFPTIHFGRVKGMFEGKPYNLPEAAALVLAKICCHGGKLPAGAPTSPTIANMVCAQLDSQLKALARKTGCIYTRYVDDITISTLHGRFHPSIVSQDGITKAWGIGDALSTVVTSNGFQIQPNKTRVLPKGTRQEVTGLIVSDSLNVKRKLVRQIRAMLHAWKRWGIESASKHFCDRYDLKQRRKKPPDFSRVVRGKIEFVGSVRGRDDFVYLDLLSRYCELEEKARFPKIIAGPRAGDRVLGRSIWLIEEVDGERQGTGFAAEHIGILTANHVVEKRAEAQNPAKPGRKYPAKILKKHTHYDVAAIEIAAPLPVRLRIGSAVGLAVGDRVKILGLPRYRHGDGVNVVTASITQEKNISGVRHFAVSPPIIVGGSGGPVLNMRNEIVGIAVKGQNEPGEFTSKDEASCFVPIDVIQHLEDA